MKRNHCIEPMTFVKKTKTLFIWLFTELISNSLWKYQENMEVWYWAEAENGYLVTTVMADKEASALKVAVTALCFQPTSRGTNSKCLFSPLWGWALTIIPWSKKIPHMRLTKEPNQHMCKPQARSSHEEEYNRFPLKYHKSSATIVKDDDRSNMQVNSKEIREPINDCNRVQTNK